MVDLPHIGGHPHMGSHLHMGNHPPIHIHSPQTRQAGVHHVDTNHLINIPIGAETNFTNPYDPVNSCTEQGILLIMFTTFLLDENLPQPNACCTVAEHRFNCCKM